MEKNYKRLINNDEINIILSLESIELFRLLYTYTFAFALVDKGV